MMNPCVVSFPFLLLSFVRGKGKKIKISKKSREKRKREKKNQPRSRAKLLYSFCGKRMMKGGDKDEYQSSFPPSSLLNFECKRDPERGNSAGWQRTGERGRYVFHHVVVTRREISCNPLESLQRGSRPDRTDGGWGVRCARQHPTVINNNPSEQFLFPFSIKERLLENVRDFLQPRRNARKQIDSFFSS